MEFEWNVEDPFRQFPVRNIRQINAQMFFHQESPNNYRKIYKPVHGRFRGMVICVWYCNLGQVFPIPNPIVVEVAILNKKRKKLFSKLNQRQNPTRYG